MSEARRAHGGHDIDPSLAALAQREAEARARRVREFQVVLAVLPPPIPGEPARGVLMAPDTLVAHAGDLVSVCCRNAGLGDHLLLVEGHADADLPADEVALVEFAAGEPGAYAVAVDGVDAGRLIILPPPRDGSGPAKG